MKTSLIIFVGRADHSGALVRFFPEDAITYINDFFTEVGLGTKVRHGSAFELIKTAEKELGVTEITSKLSTTESDWIVKNRQPQNDGGSISQSSITQPISIQEKVLACH